MTFFLASSSGIPRNREDICFQMYLRKVADTEVHTFIILDRHDVSFEVSQSYS